jgi:hypothetical protein
MRIAIDFDGTLVSMDRPYSDTTTPFVLLPGAREALGALRAAGHQLLLYSARANLSLRFDPTLDPLGPRWAASPEKLELNRKRFNHMVEWVERELPGVFSAIDDGTQGKPSVDLFIDDRAVAFGHGVRTVNWAKIARMYGEAGE